MINAAVRVLHSLHLETYEWEQQVGSTEYTRVSAGDTRLMNALECVEPLCGDDERCAVVQPQVCGSCLCSNCEPGGWVRLARVDDLVLWVPAVDVMLRGGWEADEYRPPDHLRDGLLAVADVQWDRLVDRNDRLQPLTDLEPATTRDLAGWFQWSAPGSLLGAPGEPPRVDRRRLLPDPDGHAAQEGGRLDEFLRTAFEHPAPLELVPMPERPATPFHLVLDDDTTTVWTPVVLLDDRLAFPTDDGRVLVGTA